MRKRKGVTQQEVADVVGKSQRTISRWEREGIPDEYVEPYARALDVDPDELREEGEGDEERYVETEEGTGTWRNHVALDDSLSDPVKVALLALPIWWDDWLEACVVGRSNLHEEIGIAADRLDEVVETLAETEYVERVGAEDVEWVFRLREVEGTDE